MKPLILTNSSKLNKLLMRSSVMLKNKGNFIANVDKESLKKPERKPKRKSTGTDRRKRNNYKKPNKEYIISDR